MRYYLLKDKITNIKIKAIKAIREVLGGYEMALTDAKYFVDGELPLPLTDEEVQKFWAMGLAVVEIPELEALYQARKHYEGKRDRLRKQEMQISGQIRAINTRLIEMKRELW